MRLPPSLTVVAVVAVTTPFSTYGVSAATAELTALRVGKTDTRTRFVFDVSSATSYRFFSLEQPPRAVIDLYHVIPSPKRPKVALNDTAVAAIRTGTQPDGALRYVFDLKDATSAQAFALGPDGPYGNRIVLDIDTHRGLAGPAPTRDTVPGVSTLLGQRLAPENPRVETGKAVAKPRPARPATPSEATQQWSGSLSLDARLFLESPAYPRQRDQNASIALRPKYYREWDGGDQQLSFIPFGRLDSSDGQRTHADIRELYWRRQYANWAIKTGIDVVFWGVTESQHLVDIINQTDLVENIDGEEKLGQPMLNLDYLTDWGAWQFYVLPYFRERTYPGRHGRLRTEPPVAVSDPVYESGDKEQHVDYALRWSHYIGDWDIGLGYFTGTIRNPVLVPSYISGKLALTPYYPQIDQASLDMQVTSGAWLWKLEALYNKNKLENYYAYVGGFEFTQYGIGATGMDLGWLLEYNYDQRGTRSLTVLQNDIYLGARLAGNDIAGSSLLMGFVVDTDNQSTFVNIEAARRLGESWTITLETRLFSNIDQGDAFYYIKEDDYIGIELSRHF